MPSTARRLAPRATGTPAPTSAVTSIAGRRRSRRTAAILVAVLLAASTWPVARAFAMSATDASGRPNDIVSVTVRNESAQPRGDWTIQAPPNTTFAGVSRSDNPPGTLPFSCPLESATLARCRVSASWAAGNRVTSELIIDRSAAVGSYRGRSVVGSESATFTVTVLPPPAPVVTAPAEGTLSVTGPVRISGTRRPGHRVDVVVDGRPSCTATSAEDLEWSCEPVERFGLRRHTLQATQTSQGGDVSPATTVRFRVIDQLLVLQPVSGTRTGDRTPTISGRGAVPGADVSVRVAGQELHVDADEYGGWSTEPATLPFGRWSVQVEQDVDGQPAAALPATLTLDVVPPRPEIADPSDGSRTFRSRPPLTGSRAVPGATVSVELDGEAAVARVMPDGRWEATPPQDLEEGRHVLTVRQAMNDVVSDASTSTFSVASLAAPRITAPVEGARTTDRSPSLRGTAEPRAVVRLRLNGRPFTTTASARGTWRLTPTLARGAQALTATQTVEGITSPRSSLRRFTISASTAGSGSGAGAGGQGSGNTTAGTATVDPQVTAEPRPRLQPGRRSDGSGLSSRRSANDDAPADGDAPANSETTQPSSEPVPTGSTPGAGDPNDYLPVDLNLASGVLRPGFVSAYAGTLGPSAGIKPITVTLAGTLNRGVRYRSVTAAPGTCNVSTLSFSCTVTLQPGQRATLQARAIPDAIHAPAYARQQLSVTTGSATPNAYTLTTRIDRGPTEVSKLADSISNGPGTFVVLLALYLFALAAGEWERRHPRS